MILNALKRGDKYKPNKNWVRKVQCNEIENELDFFKLDETRFWNLLVLANNEDRLDIVETLLSSVAETKTSNDVIIFEWCFFHTIEHQNYNLFLKFARDSSELNKIHQPNYVPLIHAVDIEADSANQAMIDPVPLYSKKLIECGADPFFKDSKGSSAVNLAKSYEYTEFIKLVGEYA